MGGGEFQNPDGEENDNDDFLTSIDLSLHPNEVSGRPISEKVAKIVNAKFSTDLGLEKRKEILEKYKIPENCDQFYVPKVNKQIWNKVKGFSGNGICVLQGCKILLSGYQVYYL